MIAQTQFPFKEPIPVNTTKVFKMIGIGLLIGGIITAIYIGFKTMQQKQNSPVI